MTSETRARVSWGGTSSGGQQLAEELFEVGVAVVLGVSHGEKAPPAPEV